MRGRSAGPPEVQFGGYCHERFELTQFQILTVPAQAGGRSEETPLAARLFGGRTVCSQAASCPAAGMVSGSQHR